MIGYLEGEVKLLRVTGLVLLAGEVGYEVSVPVPLLSDTKAGQRISLYVHTHVREDQFSLYGFSRAEELSFFRMLLSVSGIGPKVAMAIISSTPVEKLKSSISAGDPTLLAAVSGVGKKTAEKAVVELRGKLGLSETDGELFSSEETAEIIEALSALGFQRPEITEEIKKLPGNIEGADEKMKYLIKNLGKK